MYVGKPVMVVNGAYRGLRAVMEALDTDSFSVTIKIDQVSMHVYINCISLCDHEQFEVTCSSISVYTVHVHI